MTQEANVHVIDKGTTHTEELETNKKRKKPEEITLITWKCKVSLHSRKHCLLEDGVFYQFDKSALAFDIYEQVLNLDVLIELLVQQSNLYSQQNGRNILARVEEKKPFAGLKYIMAVNQFPTTSIYWNCYYFIGNVAIQNIFTRTRYQEV